MDAVVALIIIYGRFSLSTKAIRVLLIGFSLATILEISEIWSHEVNAYSLKNGNFSVIEGRIENFSPAKNDPKGMESFEINGKYFRYSKFLATGGLNHSIAQKIGNGTQVKIYYKDNSILRIDK